MDITQADIFPDIDLEAFRKKLSLGGNAQFKNTRTTAVGNESIPQENRLTVGVHFPSDSKQQSLWMFLDRNWMVGKAIDEVAKRGKIQNDNNRVPDEQKLRLFTQTGMEMPTSMTLAECHVNQRDILCLERSGVMAALAASAEGSKSGCVIA
eukprot:c7458_g1_i2.p1 GENE.c7458_g1_i2~~c7458_g1_i2.p1  ORF type:complete len:152 (+),score=40.01 c7458_g1_i2:292-747(+)